MYASPVKRTINEERDVEMDTPKSILVTRKIEIKPNSQGNVPPSTNTESSSQDNGSIIRNVLLAVIGVLAGSCCVIGIIIAGFIYRRRKKHIYIFKQ
jgi:hypothetical protein